MQKPEKKELKLPVTPPMSTQVKAILIIVTLIGGLGIAFGAVSIGLFLGNPPVTNNYYAGDNYTTYNTYYNTTYIYNNQTGQRSIYNCCLFQISGLPQNTIVYFFNLSLQYKTILELFMLKNDGGASFVGVQITYNLSISGNSSRSQDYLFDPSGSTGTMWYSDTVANLRIYLPYTLPNGSDYLCQFRIEHGDARSGYFQIILGYTVYL